MERMARVGTGLVLATGLAVLIGWYTGTAWLTTLSPFEGAMRPNTALALMALSVAIVFPGRRALALGAGVAALGAATLVEYALSRPLGFDLLLPGLDLGGTSARMALSTAVCLLLLGLAVIAATRTWVWAMRALAAGVFGVGYVALLGYMYDVSSLYSVGGFSGVALPTAASLVVLSLALLFLDPKAGLVTLLRDQGSAGRMLRLLVPFVVITPAFLEWLRLRAQDQGWFDANVGMAIVTMSMTVLGGALAWHCARRLRAFDRERQKVEQSLADSNRWLTTLVHLAPVGIVELDAEGLATSANAEVLAISGRPESDILGAGWAASLHPDDVDRVASEWAESIAAGQPYETSTRVVTPDGVVKWVHARTSPLKDQAVVTGFLAIVMDVTASHAAEEEAASTRMLRALVERSMEATVVTGYDGVVTFTNPAVERILGRSGADFAGLPLLDLVSPEDRSAVEIHAQAHPSDPAPSPVTEFRILHADGGYRWVEATATRLDDPTSAGLVWTLRDVSQRRTALEEMTEVALHDPLTGLANRLLLSDRLAQATTRRHPQGALLFIDLDGFKQVNDELGHAAGDELLKAVAERLSHTVRPEDSCGRWSGDEFIVLNESLRTRAEAAAFADRVSTAIAHPVEIAGRMIVPQASIGIAMLDEGNSPDQVIDLADEHMYRVKNEHRNARTT